MGNDPLKNDPLKNDSLKNEPRIAPGWPGIEPRWTSSAKTGIGTALNLHSRVWFTLSHGILNEIYFPRVDQACIRDFGLIVTDGSGFFSEEKRHCTFQNLPIEPGIPVYELTNTALDGRYRIEKEVLTDPWRNVVLQKIRFVPLQGELGHYICMRCWRRIWPISGTAIPAGRESTRAPRCFSRSVALPRWPWAAPRRGSNVRSGLSARPTAGKISNAISR